MRKKLYCRKHAHDVLYRGVLYTIEKTFAFHTKRILRWIGFSYGIRMRATAWCEQVTVSQKKLEKV